MNAKTHYTAKDLAGLPGMPKSVKGVIAFKGIDASPIKKKDGSDSKFSEYALASLPPETQLHLAALQTKTTVQNNSVHNNSAPPAIIRDKPLTPLADLTGRQIEIMNARVWFMRLIESQKKVKKALADIEQAIKNGEQPYTLMSDQANDRKGAGRTLSASTLMKWWSDKWLKSGKNPAALAPADGDARRVTRDALLVEWVRDYRPHSLLTPPPELAPWLPYLLDEYRRPTQPSLADAVRKVLLPIDMPRPSYSQADRLWEKIPVIYRERGRKTGAEYRALLPFTRRDWSMEEPFSCGQIDGHSWKGYVAHPVSGAHFHPEICGVICMHTKYLPGFSVGLAESWRTVSDAFRHACTIADGKFGGVFSRIEADRGAGNMAIKNADKLIGIFARTGCELVIPEKGGNPQGHGGVERSNQSIWIRAAKSLITYTGKDMDRVSRKKVYTKLETDLKAAIKEKKLGQVEKTSELLLSWREFLEFLETVVWEYNNTPHSALPKITDPATGQRRHMTPTEKVMDHINHGWQPVAVGEELLPYLFMPHERIKKIDRGEFNLHGNRYFSWELNQYHGRGMIAAYDIHDAHKVWVLTPDQQPVCQAVWNGNKVLGRPESAKEREDRQRTEGRINNKQKQIDMMRAETPEPVIELTPEARSDAEARFIELEQPMSAPATIITLPVSYKRPTFGTDLDKYQWLSAYPEQQTDDDIGWLAWYANTTEFRLMYGEDDAAYQ